MASRIAPTPTGTLTKKTHSQPHDSVMTPPSSGPTATDAPTVAPQMPNAVPRSRPWNASAISASDWANMIAPPMPWTPRMTLSSVDDSDRPQPSEARLNTASPTTKTVRRPSRSPSDPAVSRNAASISEYASMTHWMSAKSACSDRPMSGSATLTIVMSSKSMNTATQTTMSVSHFRSTIAMMTNRWKVQTFDRAVEPVAADRRPGGRPRLASRSRRADRARPRRPRPGARAHRPGRRRPAWPGRRGMGRQAPRPWRHRPPIAGAPGQAQPRATGARRRRGDRARRLDDDRGRPGGAGLGPVAADLLRRRRLRLRPARPHAPRRAARPHRRLHRRDGGARRARRRRPPHGPRLRPVAPGRARRPPGQPAPGLADGVRRPPRGRARPRPLRAVRRRADQRRRQRARHPPPRRQGDPVLRGLGACEAGALPAEVGEHRKHAAVVVLARGQVELAEDRGHVPLDRPLGDDELGRDRAVRPPLRHQRQHLALPRGQRCEGVVAFAPAEHVRDHLGVEDRAALTDTADGVDEAADLGDPVLEQVADAVGAIGEQLDRVALLDVLGEHEDAGSGQLRADDPGRLEALVDVRGGHADVDDGDIGLVGPDLSQQLLAVARLADDVEARVREQAHGALAQEDGVFGDHDAHGISARMVVPLPGGLCTSRRPSSALRRSARPRSPLPPPGWAPPRPSSRTSTTSRPSSRMTSTSTRVASA